VPGGHCASGACAPDEAQDCNGGLVCASNACKLSCGLDTDCRSDYFCSATTCHLDAIAVSPSYGDHVCVISSDQRIHCWGSNDQGQLGDGTVSGAWTTTPSTVAGINNATAVVSGSTFSCALLSDATVRCWGVNNMGQMGIGETTSPYKASPVTPTGLSPVIALAAGTGAVCAVQQGGTVKCWGYNGSGLILGSSNFMDPTPVQLTGVTGARAIALGMAHACMLTTDGTPKCWGGNFKLQAGAPESMSTLTSPRTVDNTGTGYTAVTAGNGHTCVLKNGSPTCWGDNAFGQIGDSTVLEPQPPHVLTQISGITAISAAADSTCALLTNKNVWCWGNVMSADSTAATVYPAQVNVAQAQAVAGGYQSCAILANGSVACWGWRTDSYPPGHLSPSSPVPAVGW
jgi:alpha-tubulin suppressor-like RCC1 family protein